MRNLGAGLVEHVKGEVTTLCKCWILETADGNRLGFTDHDQDIEVDAVVCRRNSGMEASAVEENIGLNANSAEVSGALQSDQITATDIAAGVYDDSRLHTFIVNWSEPSQFVRDRVWVVGEIIQEDSLFRMELRGLSSLLDQTKGRHFIGGCQAQLGDNKCKVDLDTALHRAGGHVISVISASEIIVSGLDGFEAGWFRHGQISWETGENNGQKVEILEHISTDNAVRLRLWQAAPRKIQEGDGFIALTGCDKHFSTCKAKFSNAVNFQGFPHIPGNRFALGYAANQEQLDGGVIVP